MLITAVSDVLYMLQSAQRLYVHLEHSPLRRPDWQDANIVRLQWNVNMLGPNLRREQYKDEKLPGCTLGILQPKISCECLPKRY